MHDYLQETVELICPYCGENISMVADYSGGEQQYYEDCPVCCAPILLTLELDEQGEPAELRARRDDD